MRRRTFIRAAATLPASVGAAAASVGLPTEDGDTEILRLFREHQRLIEAGQAAVVETDLSEGELNERFFDPAAQLEERIMALACETPGDFAAKLIADSCRGSSFTDWETGEIWVEARRQTGMAAG
ncbi:MAG: hypothetical protein AAF250_16215 [Pseudomonadota bacterium]